MYFGEITSSLTSWLGWLQPGHCYRSESLKKGSNDPPSWYPSKTKVAPWVQAGCPRFHPELATPAKGMPQVATEWPPGLIQGSSPGSNQSRPTYLVKPPRKMMP